MIFFRMILPVIFLLTFTGCELTIVVDRWNNGLNVEIDKTTGSGIQIQLNNLTGETIKSIVYKKVDPTFDEKNPNAEPSDWSNATTLTTNLSNGATIDNQTLSGVSSLETVFFKIEANSGRYVIFAIVPENNTKYRINVRTSK